MIEVVVTVAVLIEGALMTAGIVSTVCPAILSSEYDPQSFAFCALTLTLMRVSTVRPVKVFKVNISTVHVSNDGSVPGHAEVYDANVPSDFWNLISYAVIGE